jgi:arsenate reductase
MSADLRRRAAAEAIRTAFLLIVAQLLGAAASTGRTDWPLEDPKGKPLERVREIRNEVKDRVEKLLAEERWGSERELG